MGGGCSWVMCCLFVDIVWCYIMQGLVCIVCRLFCQDWALGWYLLSMCVIVGMLVCMHSAFLMVSVDVMVMSSAYDASCSGASGCGRFNAYMLNSMGERTPPWGTPVLNWWCVFSECYVCCRSFDVVCYEFDNSAIGMCVYRSFLVSWYMFYVSKTGDAVINWSTICMEIPDFCVQWLLKKSSYYKRKRNFHIKIVYIHTSAINLDKSGRSYTLLFCTPEIMLFLCREEHMYFWKIYTLCYFQSLITLDILHILGCKKI